MNQPYKINIINALIFILCGLSGFISKYLTTPDYQSTVALIPAILGFLLLVMTPGMRSENNIIVRTVFLMTLLFGLLLAAMVFREFRQEEPVMLNAILFGVIALSSFVSFGIYLGGFLAKRKEFQESGKKEA